MSFGEYSIDFARMKKYLNWIATNTKKLHSDLVYKNQSLI